MLSTLISVACLSGWACPVQDEVPVAVLKSGRRAQCTSAATVGDTEFATPLGSYDAFQDPIVEVVDGRREMEMLRSIREHDAGKWAQRISQRGFVEELLEGTTELIKKNPEGDYSVALRELENWGRTLRKDWGRLPTEKRVEQMWQRLPKTKPAEAAFLTGQLIAQIPGPRATFKERISLVQLRRALRGDNLAVQRAAALLAEHQGEDDLVLPLAKASVAETRPDLRQASARSLFALDERQSLTRWTMTLWRGKEPAERQYAAEHLGNFGSGPETVDALMYALAASSSRPPGRYVFFGRQITVVTDFDVEVAQAASIADPITNVIQTGAVLEVRIISTSVTRTVMRSLRKVTGVNPGPKEEDWLRWYKESRDSQGS